MNQRVRKLLPPREAAYGVRSLVDRHGMPHVPSLLSADGRYKFVRVGRLVPG